MKVIVKKRYRDKYTGDIHVPGDELEMTEERIAEIRQQPDEYIEVPEEQTGEPDVEHSGENVCDLAQIKEQLPSMDYQQLKKLAKELGVSASGSKEQLLERIGEIVEQ